MKVYRCDKCGNMMEVIQDGAIVPTCCGTSMKIVVPNNNLQRTLDELNTKKKEYNEQLMHFSDKRTEFEKFEEEVKDKYNKLRQDADDELIAKKAEYDRTVDKLKKEEYDYNNELAESRKKLEAFQKELDDSVDEIKAQKRNDFDEYSKSLDDKYEEERIRYQQIQDDVSARNDAEIASLKEHYDAKKSSIETLISEINSRKDNVESDYKSNYNDAVETTRKLQQDLENIINENGLKKAEYTKNLALKKEELQAALATTKEKYNQEIEEKKKTVQEIAKENEQKIADLRVQIVDMNNQKAIEKNKLSAYLKEKKQYFEAIKKDVESYAERVKNETMNIVDKQSALEDAHKKRIMDIKTRIAQVISEYDDLAKLKPQIIADANAEELDLIGRAKEFKQKLETLEKTHNEILQGLEERRLKALDSINKEIENLDDNNPEKLKVYEDEIVNISLAYDALLREETAKHENLNAQIAMANEEAINNENESNKANSDYDLEFNLNKKALDDEHARALQEYSDEFSRISDDYNREFTKLVKEKDNITNALGELSSDFNAVDEDINQSMLQLQKECSNKLTEIKKLYNEKLQSQRERLKLLDVMPNDRDIFLKK